MTLAGLYTAPVFKTRSAASPRRNISKKQQEIEQLFCDSTAWTRVRGFSQADAAYIQRHMLEPGYDTEACLRDMDASRINRAGPPPVPDAAASGTQRKDVPRAE